MAAAHAEMAGAGVDAEDDPAAPAGSVPTTLADVALFGGVVVAALVVLLALGGEQGARAPDAVGAGLLVAAALPLLGRRRWPLATFGVMLAVVLAYLALDYPGGAELPVILAGIWSVAVSGHRRWTLALVVTFVVIGTSHRIATEGEPALTVTVSGALLLLVALYGDGVLTRRRLREATRQQALVAEAEKESEARARVAEERLRIAHELHDVMAHTITTMTVQAGAAADQLDRDPERARTALEGMRSSARDAMAELRAVISVLRTADESTDRAPAPGLARLDEVVASAEQAGLQVRVTVEGIDEPLPSTIDLTCFRIVQESLTNVIRHSGARQVDVRLDAGTSDVVVEVTDDGRPRAGGSPPAPGFGLLGLRERTAAVGGRFEAGPLPDGGFRVRATLPLSEGDDRDR